MERLSPKGTLKRQPRVWPSEQLGALVRLPPEGKHSLSLSRFADVTTEGQVKPKSLTEGAALWGLAKVEVLVVHHEGWVGAGHSLALGYHVIMQESLRSKSVAHRRLLKSKFSPADAVIEHRLL